ncbi:hypothetical protein [Enterobacter hormaechei]|uniref:hypothetical protein n=2 Tax=Enterobacterales TaxID=91347 RepID=UPI00292EC300|nr:hypothetical protein [Enterobacter hormaechei]
MTKVTTRCGASSKPEFSTGHPITKAFLPHQRVTTEGNAMDKEQLNRTVNALRRRQLCVRESISILRRQWQADQKTLEELMPEAVAAGLAVQLEIDEP